MHFIKINSCVQIKAINTLHFYLSFFFDEEEEELTKPFHWVKYAKRARGQKAQNLDIWDNVLMWLFVLLHDDKLFLE